MIEAEWLACAEPDRLLDFLMGNLQERGTGLFGWLGLGSRGAAETRRPLISERKLRLYACACCRRVWSLLLDPRSRTAVEVSEQYADGLVSEVQLAVAAKDAVDAVSSLPGESWHLPIAISPNLQLPHSHSFLWGAMAAAEVAREGPAEDAIKALVRGAVAVAISDRDEKWAAEATGAAVRERLLRDIVGNPFRDVVVDSTWVDWNDACVRKLAQAIYESQSFDELPILADALEDAGCTSDDILRHCREPGVHVRGCWVVDLLLGKN